MTVSPEDIAAFADGELPPARHAEVAAAIARDPGLAAQVERHRRLKATLSARFAPILDAPVPAQLSALLENAHGDGVIDFAAARQSRAERRGWLHRSAWIAGPALAASLVLVLMRPGSDSPRDGYASGQLAAALDTQLVATQPAGAPTRMLLSFRDDSGRLCRAYAGEAGGGIACREANGWKLRQRSAPGAGAATDYRQAGSGEAGILAIAQEIASGPALDAEGEETARRSGWR
ncbi:MAG: hypothetical protein Q8Q73_11370 [Stagnimonas sp.]|nr:hypothetical protein [Stagnimonas sp.]